MQDKGVISQMVLPLICVDTLADPGDGKYRARACSFVGILWTLRVTFEPHLFLFRWDVET